MKTRAKQVRIFIAVFLTLLVISITIAPLRGPFIKIGVFVGFKLSLLVGFFLNGGVALYFMKKYSGALRAGSIFFAALLGACTVDILIRLIFDAGGLHVAPEQIMRSLGVVFAYAVYKGNKMIRLLLPVAGLLLCLWMSLVGYDLWLHKLNFGTFTGRIAPTAIPDFQFTDKRGETYSMSDFAGKYVTVDFWHTACGVCFSEFPLVQNLYDKYKDNPATSIISINAKIERDAEYEAFEAVERRGYSFPVYRLSIDDTMLVRLGVNVYPTVLVFDKNGMVIFRGDIENASDYMDTVLDNLTKNIKKNEKEIVYSAAAPVDYRMCGGLRWLLGKGARGRCKLLGR